MDPKNIQREINQTVDPQVEEELQSLKLKVATLKEENKKLKLNVDSCGQVCDTDNKKTRSSSPLLKSKPKGSNALFASNTMLLGFFGSAQKYHAQD